MLNNHREISTTAVTTAEKSLDKTIPLRKPTRFSSTTQLIEMAREDLIFHYLTLLVMVNGS